MVLKAPKPPVTRRTFASIWGELDYLCKKLSYWLYTRDQKSRAERYLNRLKRVLRDLPENDHAIIREEGLSLLHELKGELGGAITHREREIQLMERLHREAHLPRYKDSTRAYMLRDRDKSVLQQRRKILEALEKERARRNGD
jgi:hypothetical protein